MIKLQPNSSLQIAPRIFIFNDRTRSPHIYFLRSCYVNNCTTSEKKIILPFLYWCRFNFIHTTIIIFYRTTSKKNWLAYQSILNKHKKKYPMTTRDNSAISMLSVLRRLFASKYINPETCFQIFKWDGPAVRVIPCLTKVRTVTTFDLSLSAEKVWWSPPWRLPTTSGIFAEYKPRTFKEHIFSSFLQNVVFVLNATKNPLLKIWESNGRNSCCDPTDN